MDLNTKQVEELTGISRQNIRYYERAGLLHPSREKENMLKGQTASQEMEKGTEGEMVLTYDTKDTMASTVIGGGVLLLSSFGIVSIYMRQNLKKEPIRLLTGSEE